MTKEKDQTKSSESSEPALGNIPVHPIPIQPIPLPLPGVSGLYQSKEFIPRPIPIPKPIPGPIPQPFPGPFPISPIPIPGPWRFLKEDLRLDVDGRYPQMVASGTVRGSMISTAHWIANLSADGWNRWKGPISFKDGAVGFTDIEISVKRSWFPNQREATVTMTGGGQPTRVRTFKYSSPYFHSVEFEVDYDDRVTRTMSIDTCDHPNRPASLPCETLTIKKVFQRAGFDVKMAPGGPVDSSKAGTNATWSDMEMHDAMQIYWSRFAAKSQWALWVLFAKQHDMGSGLGGIMFDDIGPNHRQGTSLFTHSFISNPPTGDPNPGAWIRRMVFWTAIHEMGHAFNLAHSWQKSLGTPWIPLANEPEARSFMNYPFRVSGGSSTFFSDFEYRFSDGELLFMRHAPERFVQMGNADWFDHHGFEGANVSPEPSLRLDLRVNRDVASFDFLEPVVLELKLTNIAERPVLVSPRVLEPSASMVVMIKKAGQPARRYVPFAEYCWEPNTVVLSPGESLYETLPVFAGRNGWNIAEPGCYTVQVALETEDEEDLISNPLQVRISPAHGYDEEHLAQDFFSESIGRILAFGGSRFLDQGNDVLREIVERLGDQRVAIHAALALARETAQDVKQIAWDDEMQPRIELAPAEPKSSQSAYTLALADAADVSIETLGHIDYRRQVDVYSDWLNEQGDQEAAVRSQDMLLKTMKARKVHGKKILDRVLEEVKENRNRLK